MGMMVANWPQGRNARVPCAANASRELSMIGPSVSSSALWPTRARRALAAVAAALALAVPVGRAASTDISVDIGQPAAEEASRVQLRSFGKPEQKAGRWCRNTDETGIGDNKAGYAAVNVPGQVASGLYEIRMCVWGESSEFSFVAHNGKRYSAVGWGRPSGKAVWEEVRFVLRPWELDPKAKVQRFGFGSRDRQVWVSRLSFKALGPSRASQEALAQARQQARGKLVIAASGATDFRIVIPSEDDPVLRHAASELQKYLFDMAQAYLPVEASTADRVPPRCVAITTAARRNAEQAETKFPGSDGFSIVSSDDRVSIVGRSTLGALFGVYAFLERLGCRWIMPGPDGEVVPKLDVVVVDTLDVREEPAFKIRWVGQGDWALKNRCNVNSKVGDLRVGCVWKWGFHSFFGLLPPDTYWSTHPEYYPLGPTTRRRPKDYSSIQICTENAEAALTVACNIVRLFREDPRIDVIALCPNDGGGFCNCPLCRSLDRPNPDFWGRYSDRLAPFNNAVARRVSASCPDKLVKTGAYAMYMRYPGLPGYVPEPNMAVQACHPYACNNHPIESDCERNRAYFREPLEKWAKEAKHLWVYEYYIKGAWAGLLYTQTHVMRRDIPYYRRIGAEAFYTQWSSGTFHTVALSYYVAARLIWNPQADVDALIRDYCTSFYAESGEEMLAFFTALERAFIESKDCISPFGYKRVWIAAQQVFTPAALAEMEQHLSRAERLAKADVVARRIEPTRVTFEYTKRTVNYLRGVAKCFDRVESPAAPGFADAEAKAREVGERLSAGVIQHLKEHGRGSYMKSNRSKVAGLLRVHRNPRIVVLRWWGEKQNASSPRSPALPPIPGSRLVGHVSDTARVRLDQLDEGLRGKWLDVNFDDSAWPSKPFPGYWQDAGLAEVGYVGYGWYRTHVDVPADAAPKGTLLRLRFEGVDAAATVYVNGERAGEHKYVPGRSWQTPFEMDVTERIRPGRNSLVLRVYTGGGKGGVYGRVILYRVGDEPEDFMR